MRWRRFILMVICFDRHRLLEYRGCLSDGQIQEVVVLGSAGEVCVIHCQALHASRLAPVNLGQFAAPVVKQGHVVSVAEVTVQFEFALELFARWEVSNRGAWCVDNVNYAS